MISTQKRWQAEAQFLDGLTDYLSTRLAATSAYQVVPRSTLKGRLLENKKRSYKQCYDQKCQIELGRELAAEKTLATQIIKLGSSCSVSVALYDLRKATTEKAAVASGKCTEDGLVSALNQVVAVLAGK